MVRRTFVGVQGTLLGMVTFDARRVCVLESGVRDAVSMDTFRIPSHASELADEELRRLRQHEQAPPVDGGEYLTPCHVSAASMIRCLEALRARPRAVQCYTFDTGLVAALHVATVLVACWEHVLGHSRAKLMLLCGGHSSAEATAPTREAASSHAAPQPQGVVSWLSAWFTSAVTLVSPTKAGVTATQASTEWSSVQNTMVRSGISCVCYGIQPSPRLQHLASMTGGLLIPASGTAPLSATLLSLCTLPTVVTLRIPKPLVPTRILGRVVQRCEFGASHTATAPTRSGELEPDAQCCVYELEVPWARCDAQERVAGLLAFTDVAPGPTVTLEAEVSGPAFKVPLRCDVVMTDDIVSAIKCMEASLTLALCVRESLADGLAAARRCTAGITARAAGVSAIQTTLKAKFQETVRTLMSSGLDFDSAVFQHQKKDFLAPLYALYHHPILSTTPELSDHWLPAWAALALDSAPVQLLAPDVVTLGGPDGSPVIVSPLARCEGIAALDFGMFIVVLPFVAGQGASVALLRETAAGKPVVQVREGSPLAAWCAHYTTHSASMTDDKAFIAFLLEKLA